MEQITYKVGDLKNIIKESANEFKPKLGNNVKNDNVKNNEKSYKDSKKRIEDFNEDVTEEKETEVTMENDFNKNAMDYSFDYDVDENYKERVKAQAKGYTSKMEQENGIEKNADFDGNEKIYNAMKDKKRKNAEEVKNKKKSGLVGREMDDKTFEKDDMFENKKTKRLFFKHTKFLTEGHMLSRIPEEYKTNGQKIIMKDAADNEYLVEWTINGNVSKGEILSHTNKRELNEEMNRIKSLFNYKSSDYFKGTNSIMRENEEKNINTMLDGVRKCQK